MTLANTKNIKNLDMFCEYRDLETVVLLTFDTSDARI